jgi:Glycosyl hydrolase 36 superfamily, catalytic domain
MDRRRFVLTSLGSAFAAPHAFGMLMPPQSVPAAPVGPKPYGSGHFGAWFTDEWGLPAYNYTCDQTTDPQAHTSVTPGGVLGPSEHIHQVGNDRIIALASNNGSVRVCQDEGAPRFLNDYDPDNHQYAGGLGWLTDGSEILSTWYAGQTPGFARHFGMGYFRKKVSGRCYIVDQIISAPFGDDPVLLSQVTIQNISSHHASLRWIEYWGCQTHEFSFRDFIVSWSGMGTPSQLRRRAGARWMHQVEAVNGGLIEHRHFPGRTSQEDAVWQHMRAALSSHPNGFVSPIQDPPPGSWFESADAPATFLVSLDGPASALSTDGAAFFGSGGPAHPDGLARPLDGKLDSTGPRTALLLERSFSLAPGESKTLSFLYGYIVPNKVEKIDSPYDAALTPAQFDTLLLVRKYNSRAVTSLAPSAPETPAVRVVGWSLPDSCAAWKRSAPHFSVDTAPWIERETAWNHYYLRSSLTFDDYFGQHILNQNGYYQYVMGFQGAARDPLQHSLPFLFTDPAIVKGVLRYTLSEVRDNGSVPYGLTGHGVVAPMVSDNASDLPLWLIWAVSEYVLATRDTEFLSEKITAHYSDPPGRTDSVANLLARCFHHQMNDVGFGQHGVCRMLSDDWNDGLLGTWAQSALAEATAQGESVLNSAMSAWVFDEYARMLLYAAPDADLETQLHQAAEKHRNAARSQWTNQWLRRCWLGPTLGWLGEDTLWIEPQPWAILGGVTTLEQSRALVVTMNEQLRLGPLGATQMNQGPDITRPGLFGAGTVVRGGIWPSLNQTLVWALAGIDPAMAWDEWKRNSFAAHAEAYPDIWYGIWSGSDSYNAPFSKFPGATGDPSFRGYDLPVLNLHSHACFLYSATKLLGIDFTEHGVNLKPGIPSEAFRFESPLLGLSRSAQGRYEGWYAPSRAGTWTIRVTMLEPEAGMMAHAAVNGAPAPVHRLPDGAFEFTGPSSPGQPLRWSLA